MDRFCQKRRFWLKNEKIPIQNFYNKDSFLTEVPSKWQGYNAIICEPINLEVTNFMENSMGYNPEAYGRDYTSSQASIDPIMVSPL